MGSSCGGPGEWWELQGMMVGFQGMMVGFQGYRGG